MSDIFSTLDNPRLEFAMEVRLQFPDVQVIDNVPGGGRRTGVFVKSGTFEGPRLSGEAIPFSGGDYARFTPDDTAIFDARYMLREQDGTVILLNNRGYLWGRKPGVMERLRDWAFGNGDPVPHAEYYLRSSPTFETDTSSQHDWLNRHVFVGVGERKPDGNVLRYYALV